MNRDHDMTSAFRILETMPSLDLRSFSVDLIFCRPQQTSSEWRRELKGFFRQFPDLPHVSLYELTVEKGTPLDKQARRGELDLPTEAERADLYEATVEILAEHGLHRYEISNFSRTSHDRGQHNRG